MFPSCKWKILQKCFNAERLRQSQECLATVSPFNLILKLKVKWRYLKVHNWLECYTPFHHSWNNQRAMGFFQLETCQNCILQFWQKATLLNWKGPKITGWYHWLLFLGNHCLWFELRSSRDWILLSVIPMQLHWAHWNWRDNRVWYLTVVRTQKLIVFTAELVYCSGFRRQIASKKLHEPSI